MRHSLVRPSMQSDKTQRFPTITYCLLCLLGRSPSASIRGNVGCGAWRSHGGVLISTNNACDSCNSAYPISIAGAGCAFSFDRPIHLSGYEVISCNNTYPQFGYNSITGLPLGTHVQGTAGQLLVTANITIPLPPCHNKLTRTTIGECNATLLPTVIVDATDGTQLLSSYRPLVVRATASDITAVAYNVPFGIRSEIAVLSANSSNFRFAPGNQVYALFVIALRDPRASSFVAHTV